MTKSASKFAHLIGDEPVMGRPLEYDSKKHDAWATRCALLGMTDVEIATHFEIASSTFYEWKKLFPSFAQALRDGKEDADAHVANSLYLKALGTPVDEVVLDNNGEPMYDLEGKLVTKRVYINPDVQAQKHWLNNRQRKRWQEKTTSEHTGLNGAPLIPATDPIEIAKRLAFLLTAQTTE
jgi:single-stranded DNA-specific DHH superfamily exonuclease